MAPQIPQMPQAATEKVITASIEHPLSSQTKIGGSLRPVATVDKKDMVLVKTQTHAEKTVQPTIINAPSVAFLITLKKSVTLLLRKSTQTQVKS